MMQLLLACVVTLIPTIGWAAWGASDGKCTTQNKTTGTTLACTVSTANLDSGNAVFVLFGIDNTATTDGNTAMITTIVDSQSNPGWKIGFCYTNGQGSAAAGASVCMAYNDTLTTTLTSGVDTITITHPSVAARAMVSFEYTHGVGATIMARGTENSPFQLANDGADPGSITLGSVGSAEYLFLRATALERASGGTWTASTNFTTTGCNGTTGGTATNIEICGEYRIVTGTTQTSDPTGTGVDNASIGFIFSEATMPAGIVQTCSNGAGSSNTTITCSFGTNVTQNNVVACGVLYGSNTFTVTLADTASNTYSQSSFGYLDYATNTYRLSSNYAVATTGEFTGVTATFSTTVGRRSIACDEISGTATSSVDDGSNGQVDSTNSTTTDSVTTGSITTTTNGARLWAVGYDGADGCSGLAAGTNFTLGNSTVCQMYTESYTQPSAGSITPSFTPTCCTNTPFMTIAQAFKPLAVAAARRGLLLGVLP